MSVASTNYYKTAGQIHIRCLLLLIYIYYYKVELIAQNKTEEQYYKEEELKLAYPSTTAKDIIEI